MNPTADEFRRAIGCFATGVTVITTAIGGTRFGTTANAVASVSLEPPTLLVCLNTESTTGDAIARADHFAVNVLAADQRELARRFATKSSAKFEGVETTPGATGLPLIAGALAHLECATVDRLRSGTHDVVIGRARACTLDDRPPLAYFQGAFTLLHPPAPT